MIFSIRLGCHLSQLKDFDTDTEDEIGEKLGVDVVDNEDAWDTLL